MPNIRPVSDLYNYEDVLRDVSVGEPLFLTENGHRQYVVLDIADYEKMWATIRLMREVEKGRRSGETKGWLSWEDVERDFGIADD